jgi:hypothetical protein
LLEEWECLLTREEYELWLDQLEQKSGARQRTRGAPAWMRSICTLWKERSRRVAEEKKKEVAEEDLAAWAACEKEREERQNHKAVPERGPKGEEVHGNRGPTDKTTEARWTSKLGDHLMNIMDKLLAEINETLREKRSMEIEDPQIKPPRPGGPASWEIT